MKVPFIELDREIERETGMAVPEIFALYGQAGYRRTERRCLERVLRDHERAVITVGGGLVAQQDTYDTLLSQCYTVWVRATPEEHMARVVAQGDLRPMAGNDEAMADLQRILDAREPLYRRADGVVDTSGANPEQSFEHLRRLVGA
jgi:XRE family aerobic/anaerobic benzoate catabolism transcriptional regulator